jgi:hypothetical protein
MNDSSDPYLGRSGHKWWPLSPQRAMAYAVHDLVAKQSISGAAWGRISAPRGRIALGTALSVAERQRRFRARQRS